MAVAVGIAAGASAGGAAAGAVTGGVVLGLVIAKEIYDAIRKERFDKMKKRYPPIQVANAAQRLRIMLGENGEGLAIAQMLTAEQQLNMGRGFDYSYNEPITNQQVPISRQQVLEDFGFKVPSQQSSRSITKPVIKLGIANPMWAEQLANILLNITGGNLNKINA